MKRNKVNFKAVILAGGNGTRFWPLSTPKHPKQFLTLFGRRSLLVETCSRLKGMCLAKNVFVVTARHLVSVTRSELPNIPCRNIIGEPLSRDTGAAMALAVYRTSKDDDEVIGFFPSDHFIGNVLEFRKVLRKAVELACKEDVIVVLGIKPTYPSTGFGYIDPVDGNFVEKPNEVMAKKYLKRGYLWNAGMFIARSRVFKEAFAAAAPQLVDIHQSDYRNLPRISFDYAVMEKISNIKVVHGDFGWDDVGSFRALEEHFPVNQDGNVLIGKTRALTSRNVSLVSHGAPITVVGARNLVVVSTPEQILVVDKSHLEDIRKLTLF